MPRALHRILRASCLRAAAAVPCLACAATDAPTLIEEPRRRDSSAHVIEYSLVVVRPDPSVVYHLQIVVPDVRRFRIQIVAPGEARPKAR